MKLVEGQSHACQEVAAAGSNQPWNNEAGGGYNQPPGGQAQPVFKQPSLGAGNQVDVNVIVGLLKNPQKALELRPEKDLIYGVLGLVASLLGFMIWGWMIGRKIDSMLGGFLGFGGGINDFEDLLDDTPSVSGLIIGKIIMLGIVSIVALFGSLWAVGSWQGNRKSSFKDYLVRLGAMQYVFGAGFIISGVCSFINLRVALIVLVINLLTALITTVMGSLELADVRSDRKVTAVALTMAAYLVLLAILSAIFM